MHIFEVWCPEMVLKIVYSKEFCIRPHSGITVRRTDLFTQISTLLGAGLKSE